MSEQRTAVADDAQSNEVLEFWFADRARWWIKSPAFDAEIRTRFQELHAAIERGERETWRDTVRGALAYVIVLDQFSRNMFRDTARAFAGDPLARRATRAALDRGDDHVLSQAERAFLYMPLMHSEEILDQERCTELFAALGEPNQLRFAERHRDIIRRFGRFPHRNVALGRESTAEEREFLTEPGSSF